MRTTVTLEKETVDELLEVTKARNKAMAVREAVGEYLPPPPLPPPPKSRQDKVLLSPRPIIFHNFLFDQKERSG